MLKASVDFSSGLPKGLLQPMSPPHDVVSYLFGDSNAYRMDTSSFAYRMETMYPVTIRYNGAQIYSQLLDFFSASTVSQRSTPRTPPTPATMEAWQRLRDAAPTLLTNDYNKSTIYYLAEELCQRGLSKKGTKADMIARLEADDKKHGRTASTLRLSDHRLQDHLFERNLTSSDLADQASRAGEAAFVQALLAGVPASAPTSHSGEQASGRTTLAIEAASSQIFHAVESATDRSIDLNFQLNSCNTRFAQTSLTDKPASASIANSSGQSSPINTPTESPVASPPQLQQLAAGSLNALLASSGSSPQLGPFSPNSTTELAQSPFATPNPNSELNSVNTLFAQTSLADNAMAPPNPPPHSMLPYTSPYNTPSPMAQPAAVGPIPFAHPTSMADSTPMPPFAGAPMPSTSKARTPLPSGKPSLPTEAIHTAKKAEVDPAPGSVPMPAYAIANIQHMTAHGPNFALSPRSRLNVELPDGNDNVEIRVYRRGGVRPDLTRDEALNEIVARYLRTAPAQEIVNHLVRANRLGYNENDELDENYELVNPALWYVHPHVSEHPLLIQSASFRTPQRL